MEEKKKTERTRRDQTLSVITSKPFLVLESKCAQATKWLEVNEVELMILRKVQLYVEGKQVTGSLFCELCQDLLFSINKDYTLMLFGEIAAQKGEMQSDVVLLGKCDDHFFHKKCVEQVFNQEKKFICPTCKKSY